MIHHRLLISNLRRFFVHPAFLDTLSSATIHSGIDFRWSITYCMICNSEREMPQDLFPSRRSRLLWLLIPAFLLSLSAGAQDPSAATAPPPAPDVAHAEPARGGDAIFRQRCILCHNKQRGDDSPFGPPNLYTAFHGQPPLTTKVAENIIVNGKGQMPAFGAVLSRAEIQQVIAYLRKR